MIHCRRKYSHARDKTKLKYYKTILRSDTASKNICKLPAAIGLCKRLYRVVFEGAERVSGVPGNTYQIIPSINGSSVLFRPSRDISWTTGRSRY